MSVIKFAKDAKTIHITPTMSLLILLKKNKVYFLLYKVNDDFNWRKLKFPISVFIFIFKCPVKHLVQNSEISTLSFDVYATMVSVNKSSSLNLKKIMSTFHGSK